MFSWIFGFLAGASVTALILFVLAFRIAVKKNLIRFFLDKK